jgi:NEDD8-activating enzyme E1
MPSSCVLDALVSPDAQFATAGFDPTLTDWSFVELLVVGAGGIGCELLHLLAVSGFTHLTVIDMDTIELSNLNRQFLFTERDIGQAKSTVAAAAVMERCPGVSVTAVVGRLEEQPDDFYEQFDVILLALDSIPARRWVNRKVAQLATRSIIPVQVSSTQAAAAAAVVGAVRSVGTYVIEAAKLIIDTGTEGFEGHCRVIDMQHNATPCIECEMYLYNDGATRKTVPLCTLESVPRAPEHCVLYVQMKEWPDEHGGVVLNPDNPDHIHWVAQRARARQERFGIVGAAIDEMFTLGVVKNVVPAVGFTNAYVAGQAVTETLKWLTGCAPGLCNFAFLNGATEVGVFTDVQQCCSAPMADGGGDVAGRCLVCGPRPVVAVDAARVGPRAFVEGLIALSTSDEAARAELRRGTASLVFRSGATAAGGVVEVMLPRLEQPLREEVYAGGDCGAQPASTPDPAAATEGAATSHEITLAAFLAAAGHDSFLREWAHGAPIATVECFGGAEARISALVRWEVAEEAEAGAAPL